MASQTLYVHVADDGGILLVDSFAGRSMWVGLTELKRRLNNLQASGGRLLLSNERGSPLAHQAMDLIRSTGISVTQSPESHPDTVRSGGSTTLMSMAYSGAAELVQQLIERGAEVDAIDEEGLTALMYAANMGQESVVDLLIRAGADVNHRDRDGSTAVMFAAQHGFLAIVIRLLRARASIAFARVDGLTAHDFAIRNGHTRVASIILSAGLKEPDA